MAGYVYLIGTPIFRWYKIGKSRSPETRIQNLGVLLPFKIDVIGIWKAEDHSLLESLLHARYASKRINGEWFRFYKKDVDDLFMSLPDAARIFPSANNPDSVFAQFSNVDRDCPEGSTIRVVIKKKRGNFTDEERLAKRVAAVILHQEKKAKRDALKNLDFETSNSEEQYSSIPTGSQ